MAGRFPRWVVPAALVCALLLVASGAAEARRPAHIPEKEEAHLNEGLPPPAEGLDRSTPYRSWRTFLRACMDGHWEIGMHVLNLGDVARGDRKTLGPVLARQLCEVLKASDQLSAEGVVDTAVGPLAEDKPRNYVVVAEIAMPSGKQEVWLRSVRDAASNKQLWIVTRKTVSLIQGWYRGLVKGERSQREVVEVINKGLGKLPARYKLETPRAAATLFDELGRRGEFAEAARLLNLSALPADRQAKRGRKLARRLFMVLKRLRPQGFSRLSNDPGGAPERDVPFDEEQVARSKLSGQTVPVRLVRRQRQDGVKVWIFSGATVAAIDALYDSLGYGWAGDYLPSVFFDVELWSVQLWQWIALLLALLLALIIGYLLSYATRKLLLKAAGFTRWDWDDEVVKSMRGPLVMVYWVAAFVLLTAFLALAELPRRYILGGSKLIAILAAGWFLVRLVEVAAQILVRFFEEREDDMAVAMVPVAKKVLKALVVVIVVIVGLQNMGMDVGGLLAGLGIGGLAFALAAKSTLENLFGGLTIAFDRPFKVGDFVKVGDLVGTVEDLGLRSTRLRTLARTIVTIPNGQMVDSKIENFAKRDKMLYKPTFGVQYDTSLEQLRFIVDEFKRYLLQHPRVMEDFRVRFAGYGASSMDIEVFSYVSSSDFGEYTGIKEQISLDLGQIIVEAGAEFAFPSQTVYVGKDSQADPQKAQQAAAELARRQEAGELCIPEIPESVRAALQKLDPTSEPDKEDEEEQKK
jgi:MscS family membrane protein